MSVRFWMIYTMMWAVLTLISNVGDATLYDAAFGTRLDYLLGFQVDQVGAGFGFIGIPRAGISLLTTTLPKLALFDYQMFQGDLEMVRWFLAAAFGVPLIVGFVMGFIGVVRGVWS